MNRGVRQALLDQEGVQIIDISLSSQRETVVPMDHRWSPYAQGAILGLPLAHESADITRAMLEGKGYVLRYAIQSFEDIGLPVNRIHLTGGGSHLKSWSQTKANIYQKRLAIPKVTHAASFSALLLATRQLGWIGSCSIATGI